MLKQSVLALAAAASVGTVAMPETADARVTQQRVYQGKSTRVHCYRKDSTVGTIIGAGAGALLGAAVTRGPVGPIVGAVAGGVAARQIVRRCR